MQYEQALENFYTKLGTHKIMALASSLSDIVTVRNVSCIHYNNKIYFKTDRTFRKTKQLLANSNVALCFGGVQIEGTACNLGLVTSEPEGTFEKKYAEYWATSYNAYPHKESEILIEVTPHFVEIWDQDEKNCGYQVLLNFDSKTAEIVKYDDSTQ